MLPITVFIHDLTITAGKIQKPACEDGAHPRSDSLQDTGDHHPTVLVRRMGTWYVADSCPATNLDEIIGEEHSAWKDA